MKLHILPAGPIQPTSVCLLFTLGVGVCLFDAYTGRRKSDLPVKLHILPAGSA